MQNLFLSSGSLKHTAVQYFSSHPGKAVYFLWPGYDQNAGGDSVKILCRSTYFSPSAFVQPSSSRSLGLPVPLLHVLRSEIVKERYFSPRRAALEREGLWRRTAPAGWPGPLAGSDPQQSAACAVQRPQWVSGVPRTQLKLRKT